jgi:prevent-host-death family protein
METVNVHDAKTHFSRLLARVESGEEIVIGRAGVPVARLVPYQRRTEPRKPGGWAGRIHIADDFDELPEDIQRAFDGLDR